MEIFATLALQLVHFTAWIRFLVTCLVPIQDALSESHRSVIVEATTKIMRLRFCTCLKTVDRCQWIPSADLTE